VRVLFATDGGQAAATAARLLERLGDRARVRIVALSVASFDLALAEAEARGGYSPQAARSRAEQIAREAADRLAEAGFEAAPVAAEGHPALEICRAIEEGGHELGLVGAGSRSWLGQLLLGSVSTAVLQSAPCSVLVVREVREDPGPVRVLLGADGSEGAEHATRILAELADPERCSVLVVAVARPGGAEPGIGTFPPDRATTHGERLASTLASARFAVDVRVAQGHPVQVLLEEADRGGHDLVVAGSRGGGPVTRTPLGSVSDKLVRHTRAALIGR
jgi:nucleotide-binding universal stress UspA family protein